jgi:hypothetical protein
MPACESARHLELKRLALAWAQQRGFRVAAAEVSVPNLRARLDVAACRIESRSRTGAVTATAIFECKQSRADFVRDSRSRAATVSRLAALDARRIRHEATLRPFYLSLHHGDALFPELDGCDFLRTGDECYLRLVAEMAKLSARLHAQTKFDDLLRWRAANLLYVVAEPDLFAAHELPGGWGLLTRRDDRLELTTRPLWHDVAEPQQFALLHRTAVAATTAATREFASRSVAAHAPDRVSG